MLACGHDAPPFGSPLCEHLRTCREPWLSYVKWYTGTGTETELLCKSCATVRTEGGSVRTEKVCEECFEYATTEIGDLEGARGRPEILMRAEPFDVQLWHARLPIECGNIIDLAPIAHEKESFWLLLTREGDILSFDAETGISKLRAKIALDAEPNHKPWCDHKLKHRLHASLDGRFAAVVNDYGHHGQIVDLSSGKVTLNLCGGDYYAETVPFSFAFAEVNGRTIAVHRTNWNRLDVSDPSTGNLLTDRGPTSYTRDEVRPKHYLDYFHGSLYVSPNGKRIVDDGWVWHPFGVIANWRLDDWLTKNVWESEDGPSWKSICVRAYYWDHAMTWIDDRQFAVGGIGEDDNEMMEGVRIFDTEIFPTPSNLESILPRELINFAGPSGAFFSDSKHLFSSNQNGLSRWDINDGHRTGHFDGFTPTHHHPGANELAKIDDGSLVRWRITE